MKEYDGSDPNMRLETACAKLLALADMGKILLDVDDLSDSEQIKLARELISALDSMKRFVDSAVSKAPANAVLN